jgi:hypothetical protein
MKLQERVTWICKLFFLDPFRYWENWRKFEKVLISEQMGNECWIHFYIPLIFWLAWTGILKVQCWTLSLIQEIENKWWNSGRIEFILSLNLGKLKYENDLHFFSFFIKSVELAENRCMMKIWQICVKKIYITV